MNADTELLLRYASEDSQQAFAEFVTRHLGLVYHAALRQLNGDAHRAQEVTQAVFTDAARKAGKLARHPAVASWLHTSTRFAAGKTRRAEQCRQKYEQEALAMDINSDDAARDCDWERLRPMIDDAVHELSDHDREAVLQRYFEGRTFQQIGEAFRISEDAARMRVDRALAKLEALLRRRGITSTAGALAVALAYQGAAAVPAGLAASIATVAVASVAGASASLIAAFNIMNATKVTLGLVATLALGTAIYQMDAARAAESALGEARDKHAKTIARVSELESQWQRVASDLASLPTVAAQASVAERPRDSARIQDDENTLRAKALQQLLNDDPQLQALRVEQRRARFVASAGRFLKSFGLTEQQLEEAAELFVQVRPASASGIMNGESADDSVSASLRAKLRTRFGDEVGDRYDEFARNFESIGHVSTIANALFHLDEPLTAQQADRLLQICADARLPLPARPTEVWGAGDSFARSFLWNGTNGRLDWERVVVEAAPILSAGQIQVVRSLAARSRLDAQLAAVSRATVEPPTR